VVWEGRSREAPPYPDQPLSVINWNACPPSPEYPWAWAGSEFLFFGLDRNVDSIRPLEGADIVWIEEARRGCTGTRSANDQ
jgi:hypothetical protein